MKNLKKNAYIIFFITLLVVFFLLKDDFQNIIKTLQNINIFWLIVTISSIILYWLFKTLAFHIIVKKDYNDFSFLESFRQIIIVQFFNGITPFSTGGQPMHIYMLKQRNVRVAKGSNIILQDFIFYQVALVIFGIMAVLINFNLHYFDKLPILKGFILLGFLINTLVLVALLVISFSNKFDDKVVTLIIKLLTKLKIVKDEEKTLASWQEKLTDFKESAKELKKHKFIFFEGIVLNFLGLVSLYIIPLFIAFSLSDYRSLNVINTLVASAYILIVGSFIPIPGASGGIEYSFMLFFGTFIKGSNLAAMVIIWRFITYYLGLILGGILFSFRKENIQ